MMMDAMVLERANTPLVFQRLDVPQPAHGEILARVEACAICRTDLHIIDGDLDGPKLPLIPGHEIVARVITTGPGVDRTRIGKRVGIPWLGHTCGACRFCLSDRENLCDHPQFTGYTRNGGFATHVIADADYAFDLDESADPASLAPLLCAGLIGWRSLKMTEDAKKLGIYGFGAAAHIITQIAIHQRREVFAFTSPRDDAARRFALELGAVWAGSSLRAPPEELDAAIIFAPVGSLVPEALRHVRKGGRVVCGGIHMSEIPAFSYDLLWGERQLLSVANLTRQDAQEFFPAASAARVSTHIRAYPLKDANTAIADLRAGKLSGAAVLIP